MKQFLLVMITSGLILTNMTMCQTPNTENPLLQTFVAPHETAPFHLIENSHYLPAVEAALAEARGEIDAITHNTEPASFENTIVALDLAGERLNRVQSIFFNLNSAETNDEMQQLAQQIAPLLSDFSNDITLNEALFNRVQTVYSQRESLTLNPEQNTLLENTYQRFVLSGANLDEAGKERYRAITGELSKLGLRFSENVLAETNAFELLITDERDLSGLPPFLVEAAAQSAQEKGREGWLFSLQYPSYVPFMKYADNRALREKMFRAFSSKGNNGDEYDNNELIRSIVALQLEKAQLLGYPSHAALKLKRRMAETPERVNEFLHELHVASMPFARKEFAEVQDFARSQGLNGTIQRWDWAYYSEKLKNEKYNFTEEEVKPYLKLENVIEGVFDLARELYGLTLKENSDIPVYHSEVTAYEVFDRNGQFLSVLYTDFFPRDGKRPGAWMTDYRSQSNVNGQQVRPHVSIVMNFTKPTATTPSLLSFDEVTTFLHEFGHAVHGMLSQCVYPGTSGTNVYWDFVELPSQIHENWAYEKEWLDRFAVHYTSGEKMPEELIRKIVSAQNFQAGYLMERQLSFGMLDQAYYQLQENTLTDIAAFEAAAMAPTELFDPVEGSLMSTSFSHIFAGGYDAGYYSYKWAEVLDADAFSVFREHGIFNRQTADSFREHVLEKGGSEHPMILYKRFRGQEPAVDALLKRSGLVPN